MFRPYRDVLALPGALAFCSAGLLARLPMSMLGIGIVLLVESTRGSYATAGAVSAVFGLLSAVMAPRIARLVDRHGQRRVLPVAVLLHASAMTILVGCAVAGAPLWTLYASAGAGGLALGSVGSLVRARWATLLDGSPLLHTAFSLESVLDELVFVVGPLLVTVLATSVVPAAGVLCAVAAGLVGGLALAAQHSTEPVATGRRPGRGTEVWRSSGMLDLTVGFLFVGSIFGSCEIAVVAFADERGHPAAAGTALAAFATGSMLAGVVYGAVQWRTSTAARLRWSLAALTGGLLLLPLATTVPALTLLLVLAGIAIAPTLIAGMSLVQSLVAAERRTEGLTWLGTSLGLGMAGGAALAGPLIDASGARTALLLTGASGVLATAVLLIGPLLTARSAPPSQPLPDSRSVSPLP